MSADQVSIESVQCNSVLSDRNIVDQASYLIKSKGDLYQAFDSVLFRIDV